MKKAIIPLGIAAVFCLVGSVVYFSNVSYPSKLEFEGAGGTDETVESLDDAEAVLSIPAFQRGGSYYAALSALEEDPEPAEEGNSVGVEVTGYYNQNGFSENRTLLVAQNEKGLIYQYNGTQTSDGTAVTRNMFMAASKYGMFIKFNSISTVQTSTSDSSETQQYDEMTSTY